MKKIFDRCVENDGGCWIWTGAVFKSGYGAINRDGKVRTVHRTVMRLLFGEEAIHGKDVCHTCDVRLCCNPKHLFIGSRSDNMQDCSSKNRLNNWNTAKTHCPRGHEYTSDNTYIHNGKRNCWICKGRKKK